MWCIEDLKHCINYPMIGRCPSACSESTCSPSALSSPCPGRSRKDCGHLLRSLSGIPLARHRRTRPVQRPRESPPRRQVIAFPDLGACERWQKKAKDYPLLNITVSDYLEKNATPQQRKMGADLADWVVEERIAKGGFLLHNFL